jgi:hypothetical protein
MYAYDTGLITSIGLELFFVVLCGFRTLFRFTVYSPISIAQILHTCASDTIGTLSTAHYPLIKALQRISLFGNNLIPPPLYFPAFTTTTESN